MNKYVYRLTNIFLTLITITTVALTIDGISCTAVEHVPDVIYEEIKQPQLDITTMSYEAADTLFEDKALVCKEHYITVGDESVLMEEHTWARANALIHVTDWVCEVVDEFYVDLNDNKIYATDDELHKFVIGESPLDGYYDATSIALEELLEFLIDNPSEDVTYLDDGFTYEYSEVLPRGLITSGDVDYWAMSLTKDNSDYVLTVDLTYCNGLISGESFKYTISTDFADFSVPYDSEILSID